MNRKLILVVFLVALVFSAGCEAPKKDVAQERYSSIRAWQRAENRDPGFALSFFDDHCPDDWTAYTDDQCVWAVSMQEVFAPGGEYENAYTYNHFSTLADLFCVSGGSGEIAVMSWWATSQVDSLLEYDHQKCEDKTNHEWQTVTRTMDLGTGVCRDYAVVTYMLMRDLGLDGIGIVGIGTGDSTENPGHAATYVKIDDTVFTLDYGMIHTLDELQNNYNMPRIKYCATLDSVGACDF